MLNTRAPDEIEKDIQLAKKREYFETSQKLATIIIGLAITGFAAKWAKSTVSTVAGDTCGELEAEKKRAEEERSFFSKFSNRCAIL
jgi:hypothetical protein